MDFSFLHISDLHFASGVYDQDVVTKAFLTDFEQYCADGRKPDIIFVTGDISDKANKKGYEAATAFFDKVISLAGITRERLFVVPGNHDVDRGEGEDLIPSLPSIDFSDNYFDPKKQLKHILFKQKTFSNWYNEYFHGFRTLPTNTTCAAHSIEINGSKCGVIEINTALFCTKSTEDYSKLCIGRRCLDNALETINSKNPDLSIALLHHPTDYLVHFEHTLITTILSDNIDLLLVGHLHAPSLAPNGKYEGDMRILPAGALYSRKEKLNTASFFRVKGGDLRHFPVRYEPVPRPCWTVNPSLYSNRKNFGYESCEILRRFAKVESTQALDICDTIDIVASPPPPPPAPSNILSRYDRPFVGRDNLLMDIRNSFEGRPEGMVVLHGTPGAGKSETAREYARCNSELYPGGTFFVQIDSAGIPVDLATIVAKHLGLSFPVDMPLVDQCQTTLVNLFSLPVLLIYDNALTYDAISKWLPPANSPCHMLITTILDGDWQGAKCLKVSPLSPEDSLKLVSELAGEEATAAKGQLLVEAAGGLPMQICPAAFALKRAAERGSLDSVLFDLNDKAKASFQFAYGQLDTTAKLILHSASFLNTQRLQRQELLATLSDCSGIDNRQINAGLSTCQDYHLLEGSTELRMHQLFEKFLKLHTTNDELKIQIQRARIEQGKRFSLSAKHLVINPADSQRVAILLSYLITPSDWSDAIESINTENYSEIGQSLLEIGKFAEAMSWFELDVKAKENCDGHVSVDHDSLGTSLYQIGNCLDAQGNYTAAEKWHRRAAEEQEKGNVHGQVNHDNLGKSLHQVAYCLHNQGKFSEVEKWNRLAVEHKSLGDIHGKVIYNSLGVSLHQYADFFFYQGKYSSAKAWYARAAEITAKGDERGRVDQESIGKCIYQIGCCFLEQKNYAEAMEWYLCALEFFNKGDISCRISNADIATCLHQIGRCNYHLNLLLVAITYFKLSLESSLKGDKYGRVDYTSLGVSMSSIGTCFFKLGKPILATSWHMKAIEVKAKGDVHGRVDHADLGRTMGNLAYDFLKLGRIKLATKWYECAIDEQKIGDIHGNVDHLALDNYNARLNKCRMGIKNKTKNKKKK